MARVNRNQASIAFTAVSIIAIVLLIAIIAELRGEWIFDFGFFVLLLLLMLLFQCYEWAAENSPTKAILKLSMAALVGVFSIFYIACWGAMNIRDVLYRMIRAACTLFIICAVFCFVQKNCTGNRYPVRVRVWISIALFCSFFCLVLVFLGDEHW